MSGPNKEAERDNARPQNPIQATSDRTPPASASQALVPRGSPREESPFLWQSKTALKRIEDSPEVKNQGFSKGTYLALTWLASNAGGETFTATKGVIAARAGFSPRTIETCLYDLERIFLVKITRSKLPGKLAHEINTYTLTSCTRCTRVPHDVRDRPAQGAQPSRTPRLRAVRGWGNNSERSERSERKKKAKSGPASASTAPVADAGAEAGQPQEGNAGDATKAGNAFYPDFVTPPKHYMDFVQ